MHRRAPHGWDFVERGVTGSIKMKGKRRASPLSFQSCRYSGDIMPDL
jgi:hypothetical protein